MGPRQKKTIPTAKPRARAAAKPKPPSKKAAAGKTTRTPKRRITPEPDSPRKKLMQRRNPDGSTPEWDKNIRSQHQRRKTAFKMTRASLYDESINEESISELYQDLNADSLTKMTWGIPVTGGVQAPKSKRTNALKRGPARFTGNTEERYIQMLEHMRGPIREAVANDPGRTPLLRVSFEIREHIYKHLLVSQSGIFVKPDLQTLELKVVTHHAIRRTCKVLYDEGTTYIFKHNTIQTVFRKTSRAHNYWNEPVLLPLKFVSYFRNVVLDFNSECWGVDWFETADKTIQTLINAKASISCLTLVIHPKRVGLSTTAFGIATYPSGMESNPITFADFFWYDGDFQNSLRELAPRTFKMVVTKGPTKKLTIVLDMNYLAAVWKQSIELMNEVTEEILLEREAHIETQLKGLKDRFESIFEDDTTATKAGLCISNESPTELQADRVGKFSRLPYEVEVDSTEDEHEHEGFSDIAFEDDPQAICTDIDNDTEEEEDSEVENEMEEVVDGEDT